MSEARIIHADVRDGLAQLPDRSAQVCVTSPPYYMQRVYEGLEPDVWGDDGGCEHQWGTGGHHRVSPKQGHADRNTFGGGRNGEPYRAATGVDIPIGPTCRLCPAWRGLLGNEPLADCLAWARGESPCPACYVCHMRTVFAAVKRTLKDDGTLWLNLGDKYAGSGGAGGDYGKGGLREDQPKYGRIRSENLPAKNLYGVPWRVALAVQADGWILRSEIIWHKLSVAPQSATDRPTANHETLFLFSKSRRYYYDQDAERTPYKSLARVGKVIGRGVTAFAAARGNHPSASGGFPKNHDGANLRTVWTVRPEPSKSAHFAKFPSTLPRRAVLLGSRPGDTVLDPFSGTGTTGVAALTHGRDYVGIEVSAQYVDISRKRLESVQPVLAAAGGQ